MDKVKKLSELLERLNSGEEPSRVKQEAREFLATIDPAELSFAEQKLIDAGLPQESLRSLCSAHLEMVDDKLKEMKMKLERGHVIHTMVAEHEEILGFLDELEKINTSIQKLDAYDEQKEEFHKLHHIAEHLIYAESHHQREEEVLFPKLEKRGVDGPPRIMRMEHNDLRKRKHALLELSEGVNKTDFENFKKKLDTVSNFIVLHLRDHIFKENNILYPSALEIITDKHIWEALKKECDNIGYCCFSPEDRRDSNGQYTLDLTVLVPVERHEKVFETWGKMPADSELKIINDHDPKPLYYQFNAEFKGKFEWEYEQEGPVKWVVKIRKINSA